MGDPPHHRLLIVAGEASGDAHAARLLDALRADARVDAWGAAGPALKARGVETIVDMSDLNLIGFSAVVRRLPSLLGALSRLTREAARFRPDAAVLVDSPGFNFRLGPRLHRLGIRVFYYIAPQVWAWHAERARAMAGWVDRLAVVFPFEEALFRNAGVQATFVGHPLLEDLTPGVDAGTLRSELGLAAGARVLGLLPGSRPQELASHAPALLAAARRLSASRPDLVALVPLAPGLAPSQLAEACGGRIERRAEGGFRLEARTGSALVVMGRTRAVMAHATACVVASGTATLETALFGTPLVVVYRLGAMNYWIARRVVRLPHVGLPNIVAGHEVAPELIQGDCRPERIAAAIEPWLDDPVARARASRGLGAVRERLGSPGASGRAAAVLRELLA